MKKILFGSTALVAAAAFAGAANADDLTLSVGGGMDVGVGVGQYGDGGGEVRSDFHIITDGEIQFTARGTLDNGIGITVRIELEGYSSGTADDQIDEIWARISTSLGDILIGYNDTALDQVAGGIGRLGSGIGGGSWDGGNEFVINSIDHIGDTGDDGAIHYYSPNIAGFEFGVSFAPGSGQGGNADIDTNEDPENANAVFAAGAAYSNSFGDVDFTIGGGFLREDEDALGGGVDQVQYGGGIELGFGGFTVGGRVEFVEAYATGADDLEIVRYGGGVVYATGPWEFGLNAAFESAEAGVEELDTLRVNGGVAYELGDGVDLGLHVDYGGVDFEDGTPGGDFDEDSFGGALLLGISF